MTPVRKKMIRELKLQCKAYAAVSRSTPSATAMSLAGDGGVDRYSFGEMA